MKKITACILILILLLSACRGVPAAEKPTKGEMSVGIWFTYSEIARMLLSENGFEAETLTAAEKCSELGITDAYIHVRSHCDSLFRSEYFPLKKEAENYPLDAFLFITDTFHSKGIRVHAWINPYRVSTASTDIGSIASESPVSRWLSDGDPGNDSNVCVYNGIYLNPAADDTVKLITDGVREIIDKYPVDGIHIDDYFYPTASPEFDSEGYNAYAAKAESPLPLDEWRRVNVNLMISRCHSAVKQSGKEITFSVSPAASIEKNRNELYADVEHWIKNGYVDVIIPQLYFGFAYADSKFRFEALLKEWKSVAETEPNVKLYIGLGFYKTGTENENDGREWVEENDIIARQAQICFNDDTASGVTLFSYSSVFSEEKPNVMQREALNEVIKP